MHNTETLIILVHYINVNGLESVQAQFKVSEYMKRIVAQSQQGNQDFYIKHFVTPIENKDSYIECVYPNTLNEYLPEEILAKIEESEAAITQALINNSKESNDNGKGK